MARRLTLLACDGSVTIGQIDTFEGFAITGRHNAVSSWSLDAITGDPVIEDWLGRTRPRLLVVIDGRHWRSGPITRVERTLDDDGATVSILGVDDLDWLRRRVAHPTPATSAPPYSSSAYDTRTGNAAVVLAQFVDVNAGPSAVLARQVPGLTVPVPAAAGPTVTVAARYQTLLDLVAGIANPAGLGFEVVDLALRVFTPTGSAVFSTERGTLAGFHAVIQGPSANFAYIAGGGTGAARLIVETTDATSVADWGRAETFVDRRDTTDLAQLGQAGSEAIENGVVDPAITLDVVDVPGQTWLTDWNLGDLATVVLPGRNVVDVIREVEVVAEPNRPLAVRPVLGGGAIDLAVFRRLDDTTRRVRQLERI